MTNKNGWFKPYVLNPYNIEKVVQTTGPGVYVLGNVGPDKKVRVEQIKSSSNVKADLKNYLGKYHMFMYKPFKHQLDTFMHRQEQMQFSGI